LSWRSKFHRETPGSTEIKGTNTKSLGISIIGFSKWALDLKEKHRLYLNPNLVPSLTKITCSAFLQPGKNKDWHLQVHSAGRPLQ
jgi:hypothetical protein